MSRLRTRSTLVTFGIAALFSATPSLATQPPDPTNSDTDANTAGGTGALANLTEGPFSNTAFGYYSLNQNTGGEYNVAYGAFALESNTYGSQNTSLGWDTLVYNTTGSANTASGVQALFSNTSGNYNAASGFETLFQNSTGSYNTATGMDALYSNTTANYNVATGVNALYSNTTGASNVAMGYQALFSNTTASNNVGIGSSALYHNTTGASNTAIGFDALVDNTTGINNNGIGYGTLVHNTTGNANVTNGFLAMEANTSGSYNLADGYYSLSGNTTGSYNIAIGTHAGNAITTGSNNVEIANQGASGDTATIRIGTEGTQTQAFLAGVSGVTISNGAEVVVNSNGQLGAVMSSERYKQDIEDVGDQSEKLAQLRPVSYHYKADPNGEKQFGLIAEEVAKVYPELVVRGSDGAIESVQYHQLIPVLLSQAQRQEARAKHDEQEIADLKALVKDVALLKASNTELANRLNHLELKNTTASIESTDNRMFVSVPVTR